MAAGSEIERPAAAVRSEPFQIRHCRPPYVSTCPVDGTGCQVSRFEIRRFLNPNVSGRLLFLQPHVIVLSGRSGSWS